MEFPVNCSSCLARAEVFKSSRPNSFFLSKRFNVAVLLFRFITVTLLVSQNPPRHNHSFASFPCCLLERYVCVYATDTFCKEITRVTIFAPLPLLRHDSSHRPRQTIESYAKNLNTFFLKSTLTIKSSVSFNIASVWASIVNAQHTLSSMEIVCCLMAAKVQFPRKCNSFFWNNPKI